MKTEMDASLVGRVLDEASRERRNAHADLADSVSSLNEKTRLLNSEYGGLLEEQRTAEAHIRAHARYKELLPAQEWDKQQRPLDRAVQKARAAAAAYQEDALKQLAPLQKRVNEQQERVSSIEQEWRIHARHAEASGLSMDAYWKPGDPED
jgi:uncharacterized protein with WD repeat